MLSHPENSRKQEIIHQCSHLPQTQKCDSCDSCDSFQRRGIWIWAAFKLLLLYLTYYIYLYIL